jgi:hypothetical protein
MNKKIRPSKCDVRRLALARGVPWRSSFRRLGLPRGPALWLSAFLFASCSNIRVDTVEEERFDSYPCSDNVLCAVDDRIRVLERIRIVSGGVARNSTGTLNPGCVSSGSSYRCVTREYVYEQPLKNSAVSAELFHDFADGYASSRVTPVPSKCEVVTTKKSVDERYRAVDQYYNFAYADPSSFRVIDRTGSALEDHTVAVFQCNRDCAYDLKNNRWINRIEVVLSKSRTSGRLPPSVKQARVDAVETFLNYCLMEGV